MDDKAGLGLVATLENEAAQLGLGILPGSRLLKSGLYFLESLVSFFL